MSDEDELQKLQLVWVQYGWNSLKSKYNSHLVENISSSFPQ